MFVESVFQATLHWKSTQLVTLISGRIHVTYVLEHSVRLAAFSAISRHILMNDAINVLCASIDFHRLPTWSHIWRNTQVPGLHYIPSVIVLTTLCAVLAVIDAVLYMKAQFMGSRKWSIVVTIAVPLFSHLLSFPELSVSVVGIHFLLTLCLMAWQWCHL